MIDARDIGQGHPGIDGRNIAGQDTLVVLLKLLIRLDGTNGREEHTGHGYAQKETDAQKFDACSQAGPLPLQRLTKDVTKYLDVAHPLS